jgi:hypothetical protein
MHHAITMARTREDTDKIFCDAEWQADTFAGTLLMSPHHLGKFRNCDDAALEREQDDELLHAAPTVGTSHACQGEGGAKTKGPAAGFRRSRCFCWRHRGRD